MNVRPGVQRALSVIAGAALNALAASVLAAPPGAQATARPSTEAARPLRSDSASLALLERSAAAYQSARTLRAEFSQALTNPRTGTVLRSTGEFFQRGAQRFAFRFSDPTEDRIVADGAVLWLYLPSTAKGQVLKLPRAAGAGLDLAASVLREPAKRYTVTALGDTSIDGRAVSAVKLVPRSADATFTRGTLWIDVANALVRRAEFTEATGLIRTLQFGRIRTGTTLPKGVFTFTPPAGVRVIDQAALLGGSVPRTR